MVAFELKILDAIQSLHTPVLDKIMLGFTKLGDFGLIWIILAVVFLFIPKTRTVGKVLLVAMLLEVIGVNLIIKPLVARPRPYDVNPAVELISKEMRDYSFPSGHTAVAFTAVTVLYLTKMKPLWQICLPIAALIAFSRLYLYVHFPTDVLAGALLGILFGWLGLRLTRWLEKKMKENSKKQKDEKQTDTRQT